MRATLAVLFSMVMLAACAKSTDKIQPQYISPLQYADYSCKQIQMEMARLSTRMSQVGGTVNETAKSDETEMAVGMILLWPTLFWLDGDTPEAAEYSRLSGEFEALEKAAIQKECGFKIERPVIPKPAGAQQNKGSVFGTDGRR